MYNILWYTSLSFGRLSLVAVVVAFWVRLFKGLARENLTTTNIIIYA